MGPGQAVGFTALGRGCTLQTEDLWQPVQSVATGSVFPTAVAHVLSLSHVLVIVSNISKFFMNCLLWQSVVCD